MCLCLDFVATFDCIIMQNEIISNSSRSTHEKQQFSYKSSCCNKISKGIAYLSIVSTTARQQKKSGIICNGFPSKERQSRNNRSDCTAAICHYATEFWSRDLRFHHGAAKYKEEKRLPSLVLRLVSSVKGSAFLTMCFCVALACLTRALAFCVPCHTFYRCEI